MTIAIDFDDTFMADVNAWSAVIEVLKNAGHKVICVSARRNDFRNKQELQRALPTGVEVLLSYDMPKRAFAISLGYLVDVWIDDTPEAIPSKQDMIRMCG